MIAMFMVSWIMPMATTYLLPRAWRSAWRPRACAIDAASSGATATKIDISYNLATVLFYYIPMIAVVLQQVCRSASPLCDVDARDKRTGGRTGDLSRDSHDGVYHHTAVKVVDICDNSGSSSSATSDAPTADDAKQIADVAGRVLSDQRHCQ